MKRDEWVTVRRSHLEAVAEIMRGRLEAEGVPAVLRGNRISSTAGPINEFNLSWDNPLGGVEVRVHRDHLEAARAILRECEDEAPLPPRRASWPAAAAMVFAAVLVFAALAAVHPLLGLGGGAAAVLLLAVLARPRRGGRDQALKVHDHDS